MSQNTELKPLDEEDTIQAFQRTSHNGNLIALWPDAHGEPRIILGPHYPLFLTALTICAALVFFVLYNYFEKFSLFWKIIVTFSGSAFILSYIRVGLSKPGVAKPKGTPTRQQRQSFRFCHACGLLKDRKTQHCGDCDVCIEGFDHHCPWVGKCIGKDNLCAFYTFLAMTFINMLIIFVATATVNIGHPRTKTL